jgi:hypothetical protein
MQSKWLDVGQTLAAYHLQSAAYESIRPTTFGEHSDVNDMLLDRERSEDLRLSNSERTERIKISGKNSSTNRLSFGKFLTKEFKSTCKRVNRQEVQSINRPAKKGHRRGASTSLWKSKSGIEPHMTVGLEEKELLPSLFLQESAHLVSLLSAVALSTLRNEIDGVEAPLCEFTPEKTW